MKQNTGTLGKIYIGVILALIYLPIILVVIYSFNDSKSSAQWMGFTLEWYEKLFKGGRFNSALINSIVVAILSVLCAAIIGTCAAVGTASREFRTKGLFESLSMLPIMIPEIILGIALLSVFSFAKIPPGLLAITLSHITFCIPYVYIVVKSRLSGIDKSVIEAARDLGATKGYAFLSVTVPLLAPAIGGGCLLAFAMSFDDVVISFFLTAPGADMLPVKVFSSLKLGITPEINALFTLMLLTLIGVLIISSLLGKLKKNR